MGGAMVEGFARCGAFNAADITAAAPHESTLNCLKPLGVCLTTNNMEAVKNADMVFIAVKPWLVEHVANEIKSAMDYQRQTVVSVAAGISGDKLKEFFKRKDNVLPQLFIAMPNIAMSVLSAMTLVVNINGQKATEEKLIEIFDKTGGAMLTDERHLSAGMSLASCGIAYAMRYVRAASEGGVELGFKAADAQRMVMQTVRGAMDLMMQKGGHAEEWIDKVTTPGGVTIRGLNEMEHAGFTSAVIRGLKAAISSN